MLQFSTARLGEKFWKFNNFFLHIATGGWMGGYDDRLRIATGG